MGLSKLGRLAAEKEMIVVYHPYMGTGIQTAAEINRLMEMTDPKENLILGVYSLADYLK